MQFAFNKYMLITQHEKNLGNRRLKYNKGHHASTQLTYFLKQNVAPDFICEYEDKNKCDGINLYYVKADTVFLFKEQKASNPRSTVMIGSRAMKECEHHTYQDLLKTLSDTIPAGIN